MIGVVIVAVLLVFGFAEAQTNHQFKLSWTDNSDNEEGFYIYRDKTKIGGVGKNIIVFTDSVSGAPGQQFCYEISSFNHQYSDGTGNLQESARSASACGVIPQPIPAPAAPSGLTTVAMSTSMIRLSWADNSNNETGFELERRTWQPTGTSMIPIARDTVNRDDIKLTKNRTYCYRIRATGVVDSSPFSNESCATTNRK